MLDVLVSFDVRLLQAVAFTGIGRLDARSAGFETPELVDAGKRNRWRNLYFEEQPSPRNCQLYLQKPECPT